MKQEIKVDLDAIARVAFSNDENAELPKHADVVSGDDFSPAGDDLSPAGDDLNDLSPLPTESVEIIQFDDFLAIHWAMPHNALAVGISMRSNAECDLQSVALSEHGVKVARKLYDGLASNTFARKTILSPASGAMETALAIFMYGKALNSEVRRCMSAAPESQEHPEFSSVRGAQNDK